MNDNPNPKLKVALLLNRGMHALTFAPDALHRLDAFAQIVNKAPLPGVMDETYMTDNITGAEAVVTCWGTPRLTPALLSAAPGLRVIAHAAGTPRAILDPRDWPQEVRVFSAAPVIAVDVAETALGAIIDLLKYMKEFDAGMREGKWFENLTDLRRRTRRLNYRLTVGVVAASWVGRHMIRLLSPFGVKILLYDPYVSEEEAGSLGVAKTELDDLMSRSDVVTVHAPNLPSTQNLISAGMLSLLKDGAVFINTSRGAIVDEDALTAHIKSGRIRAYLDVFREEPLPLDSQLYHLPGVRLSPHMSGGHTINGGFERGDYLIDQLERFHRDGTLLGEATRDHWSLMA